MTNDLKETCPLASAGGARQDKPAHPQWRHTLRVRQLNLHSSICVYPHCLHFHYCQWRPSFYSQEREPQKLLGQPVTRSGVQLYWLLVPYEILKHIERVCMNGMYDTGLVGDSHPSRVEAAVRQNISQHF